MDRKEAIKILNRYNLLGSMSDESFAYMLLSRLRGDCSYYLGYGHRNSKYLWAEEETAHILVMKALWTFLPEDRKPEWITLKDILEYENVICN